MVLNRKKNISRFNEGFMRNYDEDSDKGYISKVNVTYPND